MNDLGDCRGLATLSSASCLPNLKYLSVACCKVGDQGARAIFKSIMESSGSAVQRMDIGGYFLQHEGILELLNALKSGHLSELQHLECRNSKYWIASRGFGDKQFRAGYQEGLMAFARFLEDGQDVGGLLIVDLSEEESVSSEVAEAFVSAYANNEALTLQLVLKWPNRSFENNVEKYRKRNIALTSARNNLRDEEQIPATTGKVFLCGFPMVGKTTLRRSFQKSGISGWFSRNTKAEPRTRGIEVSKIIRKGRDEGSRIVLSVWDLAGQEEYRVLQSAFCLVESKATVFVIVCNAIYSEPQSRKDLLFWFKFVACSCERGVKRHVAVVLNCFHEDDSFMKPLWNAVIHEQKSRFADLLDIHPEPFVLNARKPSSTIELKRHLLNLSNILLQGQTLPRICTLIPDYLSSWTRRNLDCPVLLLKDCLHKIHTEWRGEDKKSILAALSFLHETGDVVFFREDMLRGVASDSDVSVSGLVVTDPNWFCRRVVGELLLPASFLKPGHSSVGSLAAADGSFSLASLHEYFKVSLISPKQLTGMLMSLGLCYRSGPDRVFIPALIPKEDTRMWEDYRVRDGNAGYWVMGRSITLLEMETMVMPAALFRRLQVNLAQDPEFGVFSNSDSTYTASKSSSSFKSKGMIVLIQFDVNESDPEDDRIDILVKSLGQTSEDPTSIRKRQLDLVEDIMSRLEPIGAYCCPGVQFQRNVIIPWSACEPTLPMRQRVLIPVETVKDQVQKSGLGQRSNWTVDDRVVSFDELLSDADLEEVERMVREKYSSIKDGARFMQIEVDEADIPVQIEDPPPGLLDAQSSYMLNAVRREGQMTRQEVRSLRNHMDSRFAELQHSINSIFDKQHQILKKVQAYQIYSAAEKDSALPRFLHLTESLGSGPWITLKRAFVSPFHIHFLCEARTTDGHMHVIEGQEGVEINNPKKWLLKLQPWLKWSLTAAVIAAKIAGAAILPGLGILFPDMSWSQGSSIALLVESAVSLGETGLNNVVDWKSISNQSSSSQNPVHVSKRPEAAIILKDLLDEIGRDEFWKKIRLRKAILVDKDRNPEKCVWVCNECYDLYERKGVLLADITP